MATGDAAQRTKSELSMTEKGDTQRGFRLLVMTASLVIVIIGIHSAQSVLSSFPVAIFLAMLGTPPVLWLERHRMPPVVAVMSVMTGMFFILLIVGTIVGVSIDNFYTKLPFYQARLQEQLAVFQSYLETKDILGMDKLLPGLVSPGAMMSLTSGLLKQLGSAVSDTILILLTVTFILFEASSFPSKLRAMLGQPLHVFPQFTRFVSDMERYMVIKTLISLATGILISLWLYLIGVDSPILWGFPAFLLNYVPNIGSTVAAMPAVLLAFIQMGMGGALLATAGYMIINIILHIVIETSLLGRKLGLSSLIVFLSLVLWGGLLGPVGLVLCIPLTMTLKFACQNYKSTRWVAILLGPKGPTEGTPLVAKTGTDLES